MRKHFVTIITFLPIQVFLFELMIPFAETFVIAYVIQNKQGACIIRFELPDGFVFSHEKGR